MPRRPANYPEGNWPPRMFAAMAAAYCGERHVEDFLERVGSDYPQPRVVQSMRRRFWYKEDLDLAIGLKVGEEQDLEFKSMGDKFREAKKGIWKNAASQVCEAG